LISILDEIVVVDLVVSEDEEVEEEENPHSSNQPTPSSNLATRVNQFDPDDLIRMMGWNVPINRSQAIEIIEGNRLAGFNITRSTIPISDRPDSPFFHSTSNPKYLDETCSAAQILDDLRKYKYI